MDEKVTKPTIETVLERMVGMEERLNQRMDAMEGRLNLRMSEMEERINQRTVAVEERFDSRADRIESDSKKTRSEMLELRADFRELNIKLKEHFPELR
jgi:hypothetical protein